ncbi:kinase-like domain-containing protein [Penicillium verhagenii]|uniref:kinase-like domain-containing protein n=1 Tax=Penicillium verhagenii TaxID=1562060 RepID=UPI002545824D|nr:kinase-like domain-containing protein [Penicillium verhagenii]KAJ5930033.1 kinase-like domain-containing protein [Penicillium verhagenii]
MPKESLNAQPHNPFEEVQSPSRPLSSHHHHTRRDEGRDTRDFVSPHILDGLTNTLTGWGWMSPEREARPNSGRTLSGQFSTTVPSAESNPAQGFMEKNRITTAATDISFAGEYGKFSKVLYYDDSNTVQLYEKKAPIEQIIPSGMSPQKPGMLTKLRRASTVKTVKELYAVKVFHHAKSTTPFPPRSQGRSSALCHPNIIPIIDILYNEQKNLCLVMPYCTGGSLHSFLFQEGPRKEKISTEEINCWSIQIFRAVAFLHENDIGHGDLRPEHIQFTSQGAVKVGGFGEDEESVRELVELLYGNNHKSSTSESGPSFGSTPTSNYKPKMCIRKKLSESSDPYLPPERFSDRRESRRQSYAHHHGSDIRAGDVWACGILYMALVSGRLLWHKAQRVNPEKSFAEYLNCRLTVDGYSHIQVLGNAEREKSV